MTAIGSVGSSASALNPYLSRTPNAVVPGEAGAARPDAARAGAAAGSGADQLTEDEQRVVRELKQRDAEVRRHEQAHASVGGPYAGPPTYEYQRGPDGGQYAVGGEVSIDTSPEDTPEETIRKMEIVRRAALAPADPSPQDLRVAADAQQKAAEARSEKITEEAAEAAEADSEDGAPDGDAPAVGASGQGGGASDGAASEGADDGTALGGTSPGPDRGQERRPAAGAGIVTGSSGDFPSVGGGIQRLETAGQGEGAAGPGESIRRQAIAAYQAAGFVRPSFAAAGLVV